jgi:hypothetical protein
MIQSFPHMPKSFANEINVEQGAGPDSTLSPFLLLPDSFGDIYAGEKFSAYIAVVNGFAQVPFYQVNLAVRLQTSTTVIDLADTRPGTDSSAHPSRVLSAGETFDMIVQQTLTELGIHTLRVSVQYLLAPNTEIKTLRKFYRFNVLQPLVISSSFVEVNGKPMVQCEVTNATKSPIYIDDVSSILLLACVASFSLILSSFFFFFFFFLLFLIQYATNTAVVYPHQPIVCSLTSTFGSRKSLGFQRHY